MNDITSIVDLNGTSIFEIHTNERQLKLECVNQSIKLSAISGLKRLRPDLA